MLQSWDSKVKLHTCTLTSFFITAMRFVLKPKLINLINIYFITFSSSAQKDTWEPTHRNQSKMAQSQATDVNKFVTLDPGSCINFADEKGLSTLNILNSSPTKNIAFKIRTTQPLCFVVKPNSGIVEAGSKAVIEINYVPNMVSVQTTRL